MFFWSYQFCCVLLFKKPWSEYNSHWTVAILESVMECFIHNMLAKEMTLITGREEEKLFTDTNENWTLKRTKQEQKMCMIKYCWQHDERLIYWILEDSTDDVYQLSLALRRYYIRNADQRKDWQKHGRCGPFQCTTRIMPTARRRESQPPMHYATRW